VTLYARFAAHLDDALDALAAEGVLPPDLDRSAVHNSLQATGQATTVQERRIDSEQYSNEFQINYNDRFVDAVMGFYFFNERQRPRDTVGLARRKRT
jgi:iron complex outermembrane receptor protein